MRHLRHFSLGRAPRPAGPVGPAAVEPSTDLAGRWLRVLSLAPVCLVTGWVVASFPLAALGAFWAPLVVPVAVLAAGVVVWCGLALIRQAGAAPRAPWWSVGCTALIAAGFAVFTAMTRSEHVIPRRDSGSYLQIAYWLAHHHGLTAPVPAGAFGSSPGTLRFASPAFYEHGTSLVPQFMTGWPAMLATVDWAGGWTGMLVLPAVIGGCAILAVAGLAARLVGARWAPLAALLVAGAWPVLRVAQSTYSEPLALLVLAGGTCLLLDLVAAARGGAGAGVRSEAGAGTGIVDPGRIRRHAFAAGLVLAGGELVRLDFGIDFALTLPVIGGLWLVSRRAVWPFLAGALVSGCLGVLDGALVTRPYVAVNWSSVRLMMVAMAAIAVAVAIGVPLVRRYGRSPWVLRRWRPVPVLAGGAVLVAAAAFVVRPYLEVDHSNATPGVIAFTETAQRTLGLPLDGTRGYTEHSLQWVAWYLGWPLLIAALVGAVGLTVRVLRGREVLWAGALAVYLGSSLLVLLRPGITPDHPWADRRLVVEVLPAMVLLATWTLAATHRWLAGVSRRAAERTGRAADGRAVDGRVVGGRVVGGLPRVVPALLAVVLLAPIALATAPVATDRTEIGEPAAVSAACAALHPGDTVVLLDQLWVPVIRAQCRLPVAQLVDPSPASVARVVASIRSTGRIPVVAGSQHGDMTAVGLEPRRIVDLDTRQDQQQLVRRPTGTWPLGIEFWIVRP